MDQDHYHLVASGEFPPFVMDNPYFRVFWTSAMVVVATHRPTCIFPGSYCHANYEFFLALSAINGQTLEKQAISVPKRFICPVNSRQEHGATELICDVTFVTLHFERLFFDKLCRDLRGTDSTRFENTLFEYDRELETLLHFFFREYAKVRLGKDLILTNLSTLLAIQMIRRLRFEDPQAKGKGSQDEYVKHVIDYFDQNYAEEFSFEQISDIAHTNKFNLIRKFRDNTGMTPYEYYLDVRIRKAMDLLKESQHKVIEVGLLCGFKNHSHFSSVFKEKTGLSPTEFRNRVR